ncbi:MAG: geranylgeranylglyceryl/heptaprenylglyceryl phosphate synthase [Ectothiorhodospiraceae bacterium]|nr:geranylgeranylglyceryl/heptaprenylglyceryl phosphate synthase [Ectothiorhodospiraceae bacterium]
MPGKDALYQRIKTDIQRQGTLLYILVDPDKVSLAELPGFTAEASEAGVDGFLVGGSLSLRAQFEETLQSIKVATDNPVVIFPGGIHHLSPNADGLLLLSIISGRNPDHLIGQHVLAAPLIKELDIEPISTGYVLVESNGVSTTEFLSNSKPIPRSKPEIAAAHAMAAEMLGMKFVYLEAGSGAPQTVPDEMVKMVSTLTDVPLIVGGGIRTPEEVAQKAQHGADIVVIGNHFENPENREQLRTFADAAHTASANVPSSV